MTSQPDGVNDLVGKDMQAALALAARMGESLARRRAELARQRTQVQQQQRRDLEERFEAERAVMRTDLAQVEQDRWWETATPDDVGHHYMEALQWEQHDDVAKNAVRSIEDQVQRRHGVSVDDYLLEVSPAERSRDTGASRERAAGERDQAAAAALAVDAHAGSRADDADARNAAAEADELWDSGDRRQALADALMKEHGDTDDGREGVTARLVADVDQGTEPNQAARAKARRPKATPTAEPGQVRDRGLSRG